MPQSVQRSTQHLESPEGATQRTFGLEDDPFERYRGNTGWRARFQARPDLPDGLAGEPYDD